MKVGISFTLDKKLIKKLKEEASNLRRSASDTLNFILEERYKEKNGNKLS